MENLEGLLSRCRAIVEDIAFAAVQEHKARGGRALGCFPVYSPVELYRAAGYLPVGLHGGGNRVEMTGADSRFGSFICSIVKSTMELAMQGRLLAFDGLVFHDICDSARNLAFLFQRNFKDSLFMEYLHLPQNAASGEAAEFLTSEYGRVLGALEARSRVKATPERLKESIRLYNRNRALLRELYRFRAERPQDLATAELYVLMRSGNSMAVEGHNALLEEALNLLARRRGKRKDAVRVIVEGSFCEQPPLELLELLDSVGCYLADDDFVLGKRWFMDDIRERGDPVRALAEAYLKDSVHSSVRHDGTVARVQALVEKVRRTKSQAVIILVAKFCEPALFDYVLYKEALEKENIPHILIEFEEKMWTFEKTRMELETFAESLLFEYA